jgi:hypothetical protein
VTRLRDHPADLAAITSEASARLQLPLADIEKDFWVVELLRSIARPVEDGLLIFKGGMRPAGSPRGDAEAIVDAKGWVPRDDRIASLPDGRPCAIGERCGDRGGDVRRVEP